MAVAEYKLGETYSKRANRAHAGNDFDQFVANLTLVISHFREAARIYRALGRVDEADNAAHHATAAEQALQQLTIARATAVTRG